MPSLKAFKRMAGLPDDIRRWAGAAEYIKAGQAAQDEMARLLSLASQKGAKVSDNAVWHPQVSRKMAEQDGLGPADFQWGQWPVSNVRIENSQSRHYPFYLRCDMPAGTPVSNQYIEDRDRKPGMQYEPTEWPGWVKVPDPVGLCLQSVEFRLYDAATSERLSEADTLLSDGVATSKPADRERIWSVLTPGTQVKVKLVAYPEFYFLNEQGAMVGYAIGNQGYFKGDEVESPVYTLTMDHDGNVSVT